MTVSELYSANNTPYDEVLIKFKDEGLDENDPIIGNSSMCKFKSVNVFTPLKIKQFFIIHFHLFFI